MSQDAKPLAQCEVKELWRGMVHSELEQYKALAEQIEVMEKKLHALGIQKVGDLARQLPSGDEHQAPGGAGAAPAGRSAAPGVAQPLQNRHAEGQRLA